MSIEISDWWAIAGLWMLAAESDQQPIQIASGPLAEIVELARSANRAERNILFITSPALGRKLAPSEIQWLAERPDFPVVI